MSLSSTSDLDILSPRGVTARIKVREDTNDAATIHSTFWTPDRLVLHDEYGLEALHLTGWALDIGAHIGSVSLALALDNPDLRIVAVEAVPENAALLAENAALAGVSDRVHVVHAAAAAPGDTRAVIRYGPYERSGIPAEHAQQSRFIGNLDVDHGPHGVTASVRAVSLDHLMERFGIERVGFLKIDCEGCEWRFLASPSIGRVDLIVGEYHVHGLTAIASVLEGTHRVESLHQDGGFGLFRATHHMLGAP